jgi:hypothetical protein
MPKRTSKPKKRKREPKEDINQLAHRLVQESTGKPTQEPETVTKAQISQLMAEMGRKGGKIGGKRRMVTMTPEERSQIALRGAHARWNKRKKTSSPQ